MKKESRSKKALVNTASYLIGMIIEIIISLVIPRLILRKFGSGNNGLCSSIEQFLSYTSLLYLGLTGATRAALYKPLSKNDQKSVNSIMAATQLFMKKVTVVTMLILIIFSCAYPLFVKSEFDWWYAASLTFIIGINTLFQYYFAMSCRIILAADQRNYILTIVDIMVLLLSSIVSVILIYTTESIHLVKVGATFAKALGPILLYFYVRKHYNLDYSVAPDSNCLKQRRDAGAHSMAQFINKNTDIVILTLFTNIKEVSVYTVYYLVVNGLNKIGTAISSGLEGAFGNIIARNENESLKRNFSVYETLIYTISSVIYTCCAILILPFIRIYTIGVYDVSYDRAVFGYLVSIAGLYSTLRIPYQTIVQATGKYKDTRNGATLEAVINIILSIILVNRFGLIGVTIGTIAAMCFRTTQYAIFTYKKIVKVSLKAYVERNIMMFLQIFSVLCIMHMLPKMEINSYFQWITYAVPVCLITTSVVIVTSLIFWKKDYKILMNIIKRALR